MALSKVSISVTKGNLARVAQSEDVISGLIVYSVSGTGTTTSKKYTSIAQVEADGITSTSAYFDAWYTLNELFLQNPSAQVWTKIVPSGSTTYTEVATLQAEAAGKIRQLGILDLGKSATGLTTATLNTIQTLLDTQETTNYTPMSVLYSPNNKSLNITGLTNLRSGTFDCPSVSIVIGADGASVGYGLTSGNTYDLGFLGSVLGIVSKCKVSTSPAFVGQFDVLDGTSDYDTIYLGGKLYSTYVQGELDTLSDYGYIFPRKFNNVAGTFVSSAAVCAPVTDDINSIQVQRTVHKAIRGVYASLVQLLNSPVKIDSKTGYIDYESILTFEDEAKKPLQLMVNANELSDMGVNVDPYQNVLSTSTVNVAIALVPYGTAEQIVVTIGLQATI